MKEVLGVDIGGVIIDKVNDNTDTSFFGDNYLRTTAVRDVFQVLGRLAAGKFADGRLHLVSKCGRRVQDKTRQWLGHHRFFEQTGIKPENLHFCRERHQKAPICHDLGITHFVDDRLDVLGYLNGIVPHLFLFDPNWSGVYGFSSRFQPRVVIVRSWSEVEKALA